MTAEMTSDSVDIVAMAVDKFAATRNYEVRCSATFRPDGLAAQARAVREKFLVRALPVS